MLYNGNMRRDQFHLVFLLSFADMIRHSGTVAHNYHGKSKTLTAKTKSSRQKQKPHGKNKKLTAKAKKLTAKTKSSRQKQKSSRQKQKAHGKSKKLTAKIPRHTSWTLKLCSQRLLGLNLTWLRLKLTCVESKLFCQPEPRCFTQTAAPSRPLQPLSVAMATQLSFKVRP